TTSVRFEAAARASAPRTADSTASPGGASTSSMPLRSGAGAQWVPVGVGVGAASSTTTAAAPGATSTRARASPASDLHPLSTLSTLAPPLAIASARTVALPRTRASAPDVGDGRRTGRVTQAWNVEAVFDRREQRLVGVRAGGDGARLRQRRDHREGHRRVSEGVGLVAADEERVGPSSREPRRRQDGGYLRGQPLVARLHGIGSATHCGRTLPHNSPIPTWARPQFVL